MNTRKRVIAILLAGAVLFNSSSFYSLAAETNEEMVVNETRENVDTPEITIDADDEHDDVPTGGEDQSELSGDIVFDNLLEEGEGIENLDESNNR